MKNNQAKKRSLIVFFASNKMNKVILQNSNV